MKKGLLSLLAVALTVVSCQNYDDQFQSLTDQITTLSGTVAGLTAITDQVTALQQLVNGLATADNLANLAGVVNTVSSGVDANADAIAENATNATNNAAAAAAATASATAAATAAGAAATAAGTAATAAGDAVATVAQQVESVQASLTAILADLENVATAADLATISATLAIVQADVKEILAGSATINQNVTINNEATLQYAETLVGTSTDDPNVIINGSVTVSTSNFSAAQVTRAQDVLNKLATILGDGVDGLSITTTHSLELPNLSFIDANYVISGGVDINDAALRTISGNLTSDQIGAIDYSQITSVADVAIVVSNKNSITSIDFSNADVESLKIGQTGVGADTVDAPKALSVKTGTSSVTTIIANAATEIIHANATSKLSSITITSGAADGQITVLATGLNQLTVTGTTTTDLFATSLNGTSTITMTNKIAEAHLTALDAAQGSINATVVDLTDLARSSGALDIAATTVDLTGFDSTIGGAITTFSGKGAVTLTNMSAATVAAPAITSLTIEDLDGNIAFPASYAELSTLNFTAKAVASANPSTQSNSITLSSLASLTTVSIDGSIQELISDGNAKLTSFTTEAGSNITSITLANATKLASVDLNHTFIEFALANVVDVRNNPALLALDLSNIGKVKTITVTGNAKLSSITPPSAILSEAGSTINVTVGVNTLTAAWTPHYPLVAATETSSATPAIPAKLVQSSLAAIDTWVGLHTAHAGVNYSYDTQVTSGTTYYANYAALVGGDVYTFTTNAATYGPAAGTMNTATETIVLAAN